MNSIYELKHLTNLFFTVENRFSETSGELCILHTLDICRIISVSLQRALYKSLQNITLFPAICRTLITASFQAMESSAKQKMLPASQ